jgi:hypothetical protein
MLISWFVVMSIRTEPEEVTNLKSAECVVILRFLPE